MMGRWELRDAMDECCIISRAEWQHKPSVTLGECDTTLTHEIPVFLFSLLIDIDHPFSAFHIDRKCLSSRIIRRKRRSNDFTLELDEGVELRASSDFGSAFRFEHRLRRPTLIGMWSERLDKTNRLDETLTKSFP